ncbi:MAG: hypothetical protein IJT50_01245 [Lentisphaeria bacterium]|nr:hypothetical protein [Lentisphaeria bacterium]
MGWGRYWKVYFGINGNVKHEVVEACDAMEASREIKKKYPNCSVQHTIQCDKSGDVRNC